MFYQSDPNLKPLRGSIVAQDTYPSPDGTQLVYMFAGFYVIGVKDPTKYEIKGAVAPYLGEAVLGGAALGASFWSTQPTTQVPRPVGAEPFRPNGVSPNQPATTPPGFPGTTSASILNAAQGIAFGAGVGGTGATYDFYYPPVRQ